MPGRSGDAPCTSRPIDRNRLMREPNALHPHLLLMLQVVVVLLVNLLVPQGHSHQSTTSKWRDLWPQAFPQAIEFVGPCGRGEVETCA